MLCSTTKNSATLFFKPWIETNISSYLTYLGCECYIHPNSPSTFYIMRRLQQFMLGAVQCALHHGELFSFELDDSMHSVYGDAKENVPNARAWLGALESACITRNTEALDFLLAMDFSKIISESSKDDTVFTSLAKLYRSLHLDEDITDALLEAQYCPTTLSHQGIWADTVELIYLPLLNIIATIAVKEGETQFNDAIEHALLQYQAYYQKDPDNDLPRTAVSVPLMGLAALAFDRLGYRVTVENRYIPTWLVEKQDWSQLPPLPDGSLRLNFPVRTRNPLEK